MQSDRPETAGSERRLRQQIIIDLEVGDDPDGVSMIVENLLHPRGIRRISRRSVPECADDCEDEGGLQTTDEIQLDYSEMSRLADGNAKNLPRAVTVKTPDLDRQIQLVRDIALTCLQAGRKRADFIVDEAGRPIGFQDWAERQFRKLVGCADGK